MTHTTPSWAPECPHTLILLPTTVISPVQAHAIISPSTSCCDYISMLHPHMVQTLLQQKGRACQETVSMHGTGAHTQTMLTR
jgi:hypothetical protein